MVQAVVGLMVVEALRRAERLLVWAGKVVCSYRPHRYKLIIRNAGPIGEMAWFYCPRCRWSSAPLILPRFP